MIQGPVLLKNQVAVSMADGATGIVLNTKEEYFLNDEEKVFHVFDSLDTARIFIENKQKENDTLEFYIYDHNYKFLECWEAIKWKH